ncbi:MAG TPA: 1,4-alpha-glucan branching protein [Verrucomicrobia bacterium]|nr:1,4-alpha-glucan branching protein [Verrucomicrobiota bacterium]
MNSIRAGILATFSLLLAALAPAQSSRSGMGSVPYEGGATFRVWAPFANSAAVAGEFNSWNATPMVRDAAGGTWSIDIPGARHGQRYKYLFNGNIWKRDPSARQVTHSSGDSVVYDPKAFDWGGDSAPSPERNDLVIYQLHIGTFAGKDPPATFDDAIARLDHIRGLGFTVVQLMPVNEFPGGRSWGYNPSDLFAIETDYGGPDALKRFVRAAHERGLAVFVDVVHNHYGPTDLDLWQFDGWSENWLGGIYFYNDGRAHTPWGSTRPDYGRPEVRAFIRDQIFMFADEYRVDGFRWDSVFHIISFSEQDPSLNPEGVQMLRDINRELSETRPRLFRIAEDHAFQHDMGFDAQWDIGFRWALFHLVADAWDSDRNMRVAAGTVSDWPEFRRVAFTEAHDYVARMNYGRSRVPAQVHPEDPGSLWARKRALLGAAVVMTTPGIPMVFQGQEMNETRAFHDDVPMNWELTNTFSGIVRAYADLIHLRRNLGGATPGLKGTGVFIRHIDNDNKVVAYTRWDRGGEGDDVVVVANFSHMDFGKKDYAVQFPSAGTWYRHFNSDSKTYSGDFGDLGADRVEAAGDPPTAIVDMGKYSLQIFSKQVPAGQTR